MADELAPLLVIAAVGIEVAAVAVTVAEAKVSTRGFQKAEAGEKQGQKAKSPVTRTGHFA